MNTGEFGVVVNHLDSGDQPFEIALRVGADRRDAGIDDQIVVGDGKSVGPDRGQERLGRLVGFFRGAANGDAGKRVKPLQSRAIRC